MPRSILTPLFAILLAAPLVAHAGPKEDAQGHVVKAMEAHDQNNFELAVKELEAAYALDPNPDLLYAIGQVYVKLERCPEAVTFYKRYLDSKPPAQAKADTKQAIKICEDKAAPPPPPPPPPPQEPPRGPFKPEPVETTVAPTSQPSPWYKDPIGDVLVVSGVASAVIGLVLYSGARSDLDTAEEAPNLAEYDELVDRARSRRTFSVLLVGGGAVLIGAGIARFMLHDDEGREPQRVGLVPVDRGGLITFGGSF